ncbi:MAG: type II secretion system protein GspN, partial [Proteobacteria bacterium]|nr:type II secretion system protein GspN [Pseudomonadota bacterium]
VGGGSLRGTWKRTATGQQIDATLRSVELEQLGLLDALIGLPTEGRGDGQVELVVDQDPKKTQGQLSLTIKKLRLGDGKAKFPIPGLGDGLTVDPVEAGKFELTAEVNDGVATIGRLRSSGPDLKLQGQGTVKLQEPLERTQFDLVLELDFGDTYKKKSTRVQAMFQLMELQPQLKRARTPAGGLRYKITGSAKRARFTPSGRHKP